MRWIDPRAGVPVRVRLMLVGAADTWLDGQPLPGGHARIEPGPHVIAVHARDLATKLPPAARLVPPVPFGVRLFSDPGPGVRDVARDFLDLAEDIRRLWTPRRPASPAWFAQDFEDEGDAGWRTLERATPDVLARVPERQRQWLSRMETVFYALGEAGPETEGPVEAWIRIAFYLSEDALTAPQGGHA